MSRARKTTRLTHRGAQACASINCRYELEPREFKDKINHSYAKYYTEKIPRFVNEWADFWQPEVNAIAVAVEGSFCLVAIAFQGFFPF